MAVLGGLGTTLIAPNLRTNGKAAGADWIDIDWPITDNSTVETVDLNHGDLTTGASMQIKVWRPAGGDWTYVGASQVFSGQSAGVSTITFDAPLAVQAGDVLGVWLSGNVDIHTVSAAGSNGESMRATIAESNSTTTITAAQVSTLSNFSLNMRAFGTISAITLVPQGAVTLGTITPGALVATVDATYTTGDETGFDYRIDGGAAVSAPALPITITGLAAQTAYTVEVRAVNGIGAGTWSAVGNFTTTATVDCVIIPILGQSNAVSRATLLGGTDDVYAGLGGAMQWGFDAQALSPATNPLDHLDEGLTSAGFWRTLVQDFVANSTFDKPILLVPVAMGGMAMSGFVPGQSLYNNMVLSINAAMATSPGNVMGPVFWWQGEGDASAELVPLYEGKWNQMRDGLITDTAMDANTPWFAAHIKGTAEKDQINVILDSIAAGLPFGDTVTTADLTQFDGTHFDMAAQREVGHRFYTAYAAEMASSTLNLLITGIPDGSFMTVLDDAAGNRLDRSSRTYASGASAVSLPVAAGTTVKGYVDDAGDPSANGAYIEGVTV